MNKNKKQLYILIIFTLILVIGIGYAILNSTLNITGNTKIKENSWDVHFENFTPASGSVTATSAGINTAGTAVNYTVTLSKPGDFYEFAVDAVNEGTIDAMINSVSITGLTSSQQKYIAYSAEYSSGADIVENQSLPANSTETLNVRVEYKKDISAGDLPSTNQELNLTFSVNYVQADGSAVSVIHPVCRRAKILHSDGTNTYGNLGTSRTLTVGDAFDCDVNGDKEYDSSTERFYYITDLDTNNDYGVLIYYSNVSSGEPVESNKVPYMTNADRDAAGKGGPQTGIKQLPTTQQWNNVSLSTTTRNIKDRYGNIMIVDFSYAGYAARFLAREDILTACYDGEHDITSTDGISVKCNFFGEGNLPYYAETLVHGTLAYAIKLNSQNKPFFGNLAPYEVVYATASVRPVIEVPKSKIKY